MDINVDSNQYDYINKEKFKLPPVVVKRVEIGSKGRYYYSLEGGKVELYASGTTIISDGYPSGSFDALTEWKINNAKEGINSELVANQRANYGTIMHMMFGYFLQGYYIPLGEVEFREYVTSVIDLNSHISHREYVLNNLYDLRKDLLSFQQWFKDYNIEPLAIELMLCSKKYSSATAIDLIAYADIRVRKDTGVVFKSGKRKGEPNLQLVTERMLIVVDFKSGRKGFFEKNKLQLLLNEIIVNENYPDLKVDRIFNWSPKNWKRLPTYNFADQTESRTMRDLLEPVMQIGKYRFKRKKKVVSNVSGGIKFGGGDYTYTVQSLEDAILNFERKKK